MRITSVGRSMCEGNHGPIKTHRVHGPHVHPGGWALRCSGLEQVLDGEQRVDRIPRRGESVAAAFLAVHQREDLDDDAAGFLEDADGALGRRAAGEYVVDHHDARTPREVALDV